MSRSVGIGTPSRSYCLAHVLVGKPASTLPEHALTPGLSDLLEQRQKPAHELDRSRRTAADMQVDGHDFFDRADDGVAAVEHAAAAGTVAGCNHPFRIGRRRVGALERDLHVEGDGTR